MSRRYEKRVNEIQAVQYNGTNVMEIVDFIGDVISIDWYEGASLEITTNNEIIECCKSDYIVKNNNYVYRNLILTLFILTKKSSKKY